MIALSQKGILAFKLSSHKVQSVWQQLKSTYLPQVYWTLSASVPSLTNNCTYPRNVSHTWPACDTAQLFRFQSKTWKQTHNKVSCFVSKYSSKQFPLPTQFRSFPMTHHVPIKRTHNCSSNLGCWLPDASDKSNQLSQTGKHSSLRCQLTASTPSSTVPSVPWRFLSLSLSQHSSTYSARQTTMLQASISRSPVSANIRQAPLLLHTTEPQVSNYSRITLHMWQLNQGHWQSKLDPPWFSCQRFSNLWQLNQVTDLSGFSCQSFSTLWQLNQGYWPSVVLMPNFLTSVATKPRPTTLRGSHAELSLFNCHLQAWRQAQ